MKVLNDFGSNGNPWTTKWVIKSLLWTHFWWVVKRIFDALSTRKVQSGSIILERRLMSPKTINPIRQTGFILSLFPLMSLHHSTISVLSWFLIFLLFWWPFSVPSQKYVGLTLMSSCQHQLIPVALCVLGCLSNCLSCSCKYNISYPDGVSFLNPSLGHTMNQLDFRPFFTSSQTLNWCTDFLDCHFKCDISRF